MRIDVKRCAELLREQDNILILTHAHPDGDTLGSGFALCRALMALGKNARVINADEIPKKYDYLYKDLSFADFKETYVVAVDVATENLLGAFADVYGGKINLCIDHHGTNTEYAENLLLIETASACEIIYQVILALGVSIDKKRLTAFIQVFQQIRAVSDMQAQRRILIALPQTLLKKVLITVQSTVLCLKRKQKHMPVLKGLQSRE